MVNAIPTENLLVIFSEEVVLKCCLSSGSSSLNGCISLVIGDQDDVSINEQLAAAQVSDGCPLEVPKSLTFRRKCCFKKCLLNKSSIKASFHSFPKGEGNLQRRLKWIQNSGNEELLSFSSASLELKYVCCGHFNDASYANKKIARLKRNAIPTENLLDVLSDQAMLNCCIGSVGSLSDVTSAVIVSDNDAIQLNDGNSYVPVIENVDSDGQGKTLWRKCCFKKCFSNKSTTKGSFHSFPKGENQLQRRLKWIQNSGNRELLFLSSSSLDKKYVCSAHFNDGSYSNKKSRRLKLDAVPSENLLDVFSAEEMLSCLIGSESILPAASTSCVLVPDQGADSDGKYSRKTQWRKCCFKKCLMNKSLTVGSFHSFPKGVKNFQRCLKWIQYSGNEELLSLSFASLGTMYVCGGHFNDASYSNCKQRRLKANAVPTENLIDCFSDEAMLNCHMRKDRCATANASSVIVSDEGSDFSSCAQSTHLSSTLNNNGNVNSNSLAPIAWRSCCFVGCECRSPVILHKFPRVYCNGQIDTVNMRRLGVWIEASGNELLLSIASSELFKKMYACSSHFEDGAYVNGNRRSKKLCVNAIPTKNILNKLSSDIMTKFPVWDLNIIDKDVIDEIVVNDGAISRSVAFDHDSYQKKFEDHMKAGVWLTCDQCKERFLHRGRRKKKCIHKPEVCASLSRENNMDPGEVPDVLNGLSYIEEQLIARIHPVVSLYKIKGHQMGYSKNVINFPQRVENFAKVLPHKISDLANIITVRTTTAITPKEFHVRGAKVLDALKWLQVNNKHYHDIVISAENVATLPVSGNVYEEIKNMEGSVMDANEVVVGVAAEGSDDLDMGSEHEEDLDVESNIPSLCVPTQDDSIRNVLDWPEMDSVPVNEFKCEGYIAQAFPCLYPTGEADLRCTRNTVINPSTYFKHMLRYCDERFAKHPRYRFFALNSMMRWTAISDGNVFVEKNPEFGNMTVKDLKEKLTADPKVLSKIMFYGRNIRGTKAFWKAKSRELVEMVEQLKLPTVFFTLSSADFHWPELFSILAPDEDQATMSEARRRQLIQENPLIVDTFFTDRAESFIDLVLKPKFKVKDFWFRIEYQHRGSPHLHGLLWMDGAPDVTNLDHMSEEELEKVVQYYDNLICTIHPDVSCPPGVLHPCRKFLSEATNIRTDLAELLNKVQRHTCTSSYCLRKNKKTHEIECRFKFPVEMQESTKLEKNDCGMYELLTARNDEHLNKYNAYIIQSWRANMDISPCLSKEALISYLTKYVTKCETKSKQLEEIMKIVFERTSEDKAAKEAVRRLYIQTCCERDFSAQEVCHLVMGLKLVSAGGRDFVSVQTSNDDKWTYVSKKSSRTQSTFVDKYRNRPDELHDMCLWEVAQKVQLPSGKKRSKNAIVMVYPKIRKGNDDTSEEAWCRQQVLLYVPWQQDESLFESEGTWKELYEKYKDQILKFNPVLSIGSIPCDDENEESVDAIDNFHMVEEYMTVASMGPTRCILEETDLGDREIDLMYDWNSNCILQDRSVANVRSLAKFISDSKAHVQTTGSNQLVMPNVTFTDEQSQILKVVEKQINFIRDGGSSTTNFNFCKRLLVQGKAGTGKSLVIHAIQAMIKNALGDDSVMLVAPTGVAAVNIGGATLHSKLHVNQSQFDLLRGSSARKFCNEMEKVKFLIVDEYSMIGLSVLGMMERRCREGKGNEDMFGGVFVYLFGDIKQLNPVLDTALYDEPKPYLELAMHGKAAFNSFDGALVLTSVMRQRDSKFKMVLDRIGCGQVTYEDYDYLKTRFKCNVSLEEIDSFKDSIRLFPQKDKVASTNKDILSKLRDSITNEPIPIARVKGKHNCVQAAVAPPDNADGLESALYLGRGAKVMLKKNLWTDMGLVNGSIGEVVDIVFEEGKSYPIDSPSIILCKFPQYRGPTVSIGGVNGIVPVGMFTKSWDSKTGKSFSRSQFPLTLAYACSIHKSQGLTLERIIVDIGSTREQCVGLSYVALSRCTSLGGLLLEPFSLKRFLKINSAKVRERELAEVEIFKKKITV